ncbi:hypothetical protein QNI16_26785 [Cytophagaceae bacterium YF14B1]|uniref:Uncharacterized protein n=1 Tax=Xanthocytophaga flava TaxID=3048013 RepID=A0AAE3QX71_9BACT|nr:hypothetical protein [Xanthocytophaga flavus]MDJ1484133.1 hypothetical protein [Xanthocytophaga flavus]
MHLLHANHKRIHYVPGLIILLVSPFLLGKIYYAQKKRESQRVILISWWKPDFIFNPFQLKRNYTHITLTGDNETDKIKLDYSQIRIREIVQSKDSSNGVLFHFSDTAKYWTFVRALDICKIENISDYAPYKNDLCIYYIPPDTLPPLCGGVFGIYTDNKQQASEEKEKWYHSLISVPSTQYLIAGFVGFVIVVIANKK